MELTDLLAAVRDEIADQAEPHLWSDETITKYLNEGENEFCRKTGILVDDTITFNTVAGTSTYSLRATYPRVIRVLGVKQGSTDLLSRQRGANLKQHLDTTSQGQPTVFSTYLAPTSVTLYPTPDAVYTITCLCTVRPTYPIEDMLEPTIDEEFHYALVNYASYKCLITNDVDGSQIGTAETFKQMWYEYIRDINRDIYRGRRTDDIILPGLTGRRNGHG